MLIPKKKRIGISNNSEAIPIVTDEDNDFRLHQLQKDFRSKLASKIQECEKTISVRFSYLIGITKGDTITCFKFLECIDNEVIVIAGSQYGSIFKINLMTKALEVLFQKHQTYGPITAIEIGQNKETIAVAASDNIHIFSLSKRQSIMSLKQPHGRAKVTALVATKDGKYVVSGAEDQSVNIFEVGNLHPVFTLRREDQVDDMDAPIPVESIALMNKGRYALVGFGEGSLVIIDVEKRMKAYTFDNLHEAAITTILVVNQNRSCITGAKDGTIGISNLQSKELIYMFEDAHDTAITCVSMLKESNILVSSATDGSVNVFDLERHERLHSYEEAHKGKIISVDLSFPNPFIISASEKEFIMRPFSNQEKSNVSTALNSIESEKSIVSVILSKTNRYLVTATQNACIQIYNFFNKEKIGELANIHTEEIVALELAGNDTLIYVAFEDGLVRFIELMTGNIVFELKDVNIEASYMKVTDDDRHLVLTLVDRSLMIINLESRQVIFHESHIHTTFVTSLSVSKDYIVTSSNDKSIKVWNLNDSGLSLVYDFKGRSESYATCTAIDRECRFIIAGLANGCIHMYDLSSFRIIAKLHNEHKKIINDVQITKSGDFFFSSSNDGTIKVFDFKRRESINTYYRPLKDVQPIRCLLSNDDDKYLVSYTPYSREIKFATNLFRSFESDFIVTTKKTTSPFYVFEKYIVNKFIETGDVVTRLNIIKKFPDLRIYPSGWNLFDIVCLFCPDKDLIKQCIDSNIPFSVNELGETPLHYLLEAKGFDFALVNFILENIQNLVTDPLHRIEVVSSLSEFVAALVKIDTPNVANFLNLAVGKPFPYKGEEIPKFGEILYGQDNRFTRACTNILMPEYKEKLIDPKGNNMVTVTALNFHLNYDPLSDDIKRIVKVLEKINEETIFQNKAISLLIDFLWIHSRRFHLVMTTIFSLIMIILSLYATYDKQDALLESLLLFFAVFMIIYEVCKLSFGGLKMYFEDAWGYLDIVFIVSLILIGVSWNLELSKLARNLSLCTAIFSGYIRWISFFRVFNSTRKFVRVIISIVKEVKAFLLIFGFLIVGASLIFYQFKGEESYPQRLFYSYLLLLAEIGDYNRLSWPEVFFFTIITFFITVILLNILIALMTDAYEKILASSATNDSKERVTMILESITLLRVFSFFCNVNLAREEHIEAILPFQTKEEIQMNRGYLFNVTQGINPLESRSKDPAPIRVNSGQGHGSGGEWEGRVNSLKIHITSIIKKHIDPLVNQTAAFKAQQEEIRRLNQKMAFLQQDMKMILAYFIDKDKKENEHDKIDKLAMFSPLQNIVASMANEAIDEGYQSGDINKKAEYPEDAEDEIVQ